jgi:hypothetical protein
VLYIIHQTNAGAKNMYQYNLTIKCGNEKVSIDFTVPSKKEAKQEGEFLAMSYGWKTNSIWKVHSLKYLGSFTKKEISEFSKDFDNLSETHKKEIENQIASVRKNKTSKERLQSDRDFIQSFLK